MSAATMLYIPHGGGPLPLLDEAGHANLNGFLRGFAATIAKPDAIIVVSAHWEESIISVTAAERPGMIFDYSGFPAETYEYDYPAPGKPGLAIKMVEMLSAGQIDAKTDAQRGYDHGLYVPLLLMYPDADIPCVQISLSNSLDAGLHIRIGKALAELKNQNLLILGSGFSFHNMQALMAKKDNSIDPRNREFEAWLAETCSNIDITESEREARFTNWRNAPHASYCHPREEHLLPLQVCYGVAQAPAKTVFQDKVSGFMASAYQWS